MKKSKKTVKSHVLRKVIFGILLIIASCGISACIYILNLPAWGDLDTDKIFGADASLIVYDCDGNESSIMYGSENRICIGIEAVPERVQKAFVSAEDARFYEHVGIDAIRIGGAIIEDIKAGGYVQGASTITQQLIKLSHLSSEKKLSRKINEAILAYTLEKNYDKDEILEMYLNYVYFGGGYYGIESAARGYFGVSASELTVAQGAQLAGILKSPSRYAPHIDMEASLSRRNLILELMCEYGYISESERDAFCAEEAVLCDSDTKNNLHSYYIDTVLSEACSTLGVDMSELLTGGYRVYSALDTDIQEECERIACDKSLRCSEDAQMAIAVVCAKSGMLTAVVGGTATDSVMGYNRATEIRRQPGSVIKPIIAYAPALEYFGYTSATIIDDSPKSYGNYRPQNYNNKYHGKVTLRKAISSSLNIPAVEVLSDIGVDVGMRFSKSVGIEFAENDKSLALALGGFTYGVSPLQIANAYAVFASGGYYEKACTIERIEDSNGNELWRNDHVRKQVMSSENAFILTSMLQSVVDDGTGRRLGDIGIPLAGKTGTVGEHDNDGNRDAWMVAYNSEYSIAVWNGYDSSDEGTMPESATGGNYPAKMLSAVFKKIYKDKKAPEFAIPVGVTCVELDTYYRNASDTPVLATAYTQEKYKIDEYFVVGTEPTEYSPYWTMPKAPEKIRLSLTDMGFVTIEFIAADLNTEYRIYRVQDGITILLTQTRGESGKVLYTDRFVQEGNAEYYVVPIRTDYGGEACVIGDESVHEKITIVRQHG